MFSLLLAVALAAEPAPSTRPGPEASPPAPALPTLRVADLVEGSPAALGPAARTRSLAGQRVRLLGFMARLEEPLAGAFWLAAGPVECDESGAGTADLPAGSVLVLTGESGRAPEGHVAGPVAVTGVLRVGQEAAADGQVSAFQLLLDPVPSAPTPPSPSMSHPTPKGVRHDARP